MKIQDLIQLENGKTPDMNAVIDELKSKRGLQKNIEQIKEQIEPTGHDVFKKNKRPDKKVRVDPLALDPSEEVASSGKDEKGESYVMVWNRVARIGLAIQKLIVKRAVSFVFGNAVKLLCTPSNDNEKKVLYAVQRIFHDVKIKSHHRKVARNLFSCTEVAELWYPVPVETTKTGNTMFDNVKDALNNLIGIKYHNQYGFKSAYYLKNAIFSPLLGDTLYPYFNDNGEMTAFSREFSTTRKDGTIVKYFETYTDEEHWMWETDSAGYRIVDGYPKKNGIGKIPVVYGKQDEVEWQDVQNLIDRLEKLLSNFAETNDYHASPKIFVKGELKGYAKKGDSNTILQAESDADAKYLSWQNAPESVKLEIETLLRMIYTLTQTPDFSFDAVKGIGSISGIALKLLFLDAHLKVADHQEVLDEYLQREINIVKTFVGKFNTSIANDAYNLMIEPEIKPYMIRDEAAELKIWSDANGGNAVMSQKASFQKAGMTSDPDADYEQYQKEQSAANTFNIGEPTPA